MPSTLSQPWLHPADDVAAALDTDLARGLTSEEARRRLERFGPNLLEVDDKVARWRQVVGRFADPLVYLLIGASVIALVAWIVEGRQGIPFDAIVISIILVINAILGYVQEARAEEAVAALRRMTATTAGVIRDGRETELPADGLVPGDLLVLAEGDAVCADARLSEVAALTVAEAALTGESEPVLKEVTTLTGEPTLGDRINMVASGTAVTRGRGRAVVTATGMGSEMGRVARLLTDAGPEATPLQIEVARIGRLLGVAVVFIAAVVTGTILATSEIRGAGDAVEVLLVGVALAVAAVPEGLPAIISVVLGLGVLRMARRQAIVKRLASVESLGSASVVCTDKTGTVTRNEMTIEVAVSASGEVAITGTGYRPDGEVLLDGVPLEDPVLLDEVHDLIGAGCLANDAALAERDGEWLIQGDPTEAAFLVAEAKLGRTASRLARFDRVDEVPFTSERRLMSTVQTDRRDLESLVVTTKGAPDVLLGRCTHERRREEVHPLSEQRRTEILDVVDRLADEALRTLGVAYRIVPVAGTPPVDESIEHKLVYLGMVGIIDPPRPEAAAAIAEARAAGIRVILITGDHPRTAARIASDLGVVEPGAPALTGVELDRLSAEQLSDAVRHVSVYARVSPENKLQLVEALQADGAVVAMTGDGVNDAPALKSADIGVCMGGTGTEVAKEAADMILADDNFATIVDAVCEGRAIFTNIRSFLRFLLSSNAGEVATVFFGVVLAATLGFAATGETVSAPLLATQILWINLLTDTGPALALGVDPPGDDLMHRPPRRRDDRMIDTEMLIGIVWIGSVMAAVSLLALDMRLPGGLVDGDGDLTAARTMAFTTLVLAQMFNCFNARSDRTSAFHGLFTNPLLWAAIGLSVSLQAAVVHVPLLNAAFGTAPMSATDWLTCVALASGVLWAGEARKLVAGRARSHRT